MEMFVSDVPNLPGLGSTSSGRRH